MGGVLAARPGGVPKGGGGLSAAHYYHMHTSRVCVCVSGGMGVSRYVCDNSDFSS